MNFPKIERKQSVNFPVGALASVEKVIANKIGPPLKDGPEGLASFVDHGMLPI
jgi:hypothetical protein